MNLVFTPAPDLARIALQVGLVGEKLAHIEGAIKHGLRLDEADSCELPSYGIHAQDLVREESLRAIAPAGWAFVVQTEETKSMKAEYSIAYVAEGKSGNPQLTHLRHDWAALAILTTLDAIKAGAMRKSGSYQPKLMQIHGLGLVALWFWGEKEQEDRVIPLLRREVNRPFVLKGQMRTGRAFRRLVMQGWANHTYSDNRPRLASSQDTVELRG